MPTMNSPSTYDISQRTFPANNRAVTPEPSLYSLKGMLKLGGRNPEPEPVSRPEVAKKHSSLLKLTTLRRKSLVATPAQGVTMNGSAESLPFDAEPETPSPTTPKSAKSGKKLQKRMPSVVRKEHERNSRWKRDGNEDLSNLSRISLVYEVPSTNKESSTSPDPVPELPTSWPNTSTDRQRPTRRATTPAEALTELIGEESPQARDLSDDEDAKSLRRRSLSMSNKTRSRSRAKRRSTISNAAPDSDIPDVPSRRSFSIGLLRSQSKSRSGSTTPKRRSVDYSAFGEHSDDGASEGMPMYSDFGSVARSLGGNPYDISTDMMQGRSRGTGPVLDQLQSPHQISTSSAGGKSGGLRGMDESMASELARRKSRDVAIQRNKAVFDRPRMVTPGQSSQQDILRPQSTEVTTPTQEQHVSGWKAKPVFQDKSLERGDFDLRARPHSISDIPSVPQMPADAELRALKATEYFKRMGKGSPMLASSPSTGSSVDGVEKSGFSTVSVADAVALALAARTKQEAKAAKQARKSQGSTASTPRAVKTTSILKKSTSTLQDASESSGSGSAASTPMGTSPDEPNTVAIARPEITAEPEPIAQAVSTEQEDTHVHTNTIANLENSSESKPALSGWERQAEIWRERRENAGQSLTKTITEDEGLQTVVHSPADIVHSTSSSSAGSMPAAPVPASNHHRRSSATRAISYQDLIGTEPATPMAQSTISQMSTQTTDSTTVLLHSSTHTVTIETAFPVRSHQATVVHTPGTTTTTSSRVQSPTGSYFPYTPDRVPNPSHARAKSVPRAELPDARSTKSLDMPRRRPVPKKTEATDSNSGRQSRPLSPIPASEAGSVDPPEQFVSSQHPLVDRYGGGLQYGYQPGVGLHTSSGLRASMGSAAPKQGSALGQSHGLDLSDVPMMLRRA